LQDYTIVSFLPDFEITADDFNLSSYDLWSKEVQLSWKEKPALKKLIGISWLFKIVLAIDVLADNYDLTCLVIVL
jgi:hypothetical protein